MNKLMDPDEEMSADQPCQDLQPFDIFTPDVINQTEGASAVYAPIFNKIRIYGTTDYPVFIAKDVEEVLKIKDLHYKHENGPFEWGEDKVKVKVMTQVGKREAIAFTEQGLYNAIWMSKTPEAKQFKRFMTCIMKRLRQTGSVTMDEAVADLKVENDRLRSTVLAYDIQMDAEHRELMHYKYQHDNLVISHQDHVLALIKARKRLENARDPDAVRLLERYEATMRKYGRVVYVSLCRPPKEYEDQLWDYDFDIVDEGDVEIMDPQDTLILSISLKKMESRKFLKCVYIHKNLKLEDLHTALVQFRLAKHDKKGDDAGWHANHYEISLSQLDTAVDDLNRTNEALPPEED